MQKDTRLLQTCSKGYTSLLLYDICHTGVSLQIRLDYTPQLQRNSKIYAGMRFLIFTRKWHRAVFDESSRTSLTGLSVLLRHAMFIFSLIGFEYVRDLHSGLSSAMARHSLKLTGSLCLGSIN